MQRSEKADNALQPGKGLAEKWTFSQWFLLVVGLTEVTCSAQLSMQVDLSLPPVALVVSPLVAKLYFLQVTVVLELGYFCISSPSHCRQSSQCT